MVAWMADATSEPCTLHSLLALRPAFVRSATDIISPLSAIRLIQSAGQRTIEAHPIGTASLKTAAWNSKISGAGTLQRIRQFRDVEDGWDGMDGRKPDFGSLNAAEMLVAFFEDLPSSRAPAFAVDAFGRPSFLIEDSEIYATVTVDSAETISWYVDKLGEENVGEAQPFDGTSLPLDLRSALFG